MGWRARLQAAREILWGHWWFRLGLSAWVAISGYDTFSGAVSQVLPAYELVPLGALVMGGSHLLPWWGWLLVLQMLLFASVVEYVIRHVRASTPDDIRCQLDQLQRSIQALEGRAPTDGEELEQRLRGLTLYVGASSAKDQVLSGWEWAISHGEELLAREPGDDEAEHQWALDYGAWRSSMKPWASGVEEYFPQLWDRLFVGMEGAANEREVARKLVDNLKELGPDLRRAMNPNLPLV